MTSPARLALLQLPAFSIDQAAESLAHTLRRIDDAARERPDIIVLPEGTYPAYVLGGRDYARDGVLSPGDAMRVLADKAREHGVYISAGMALDAPGGGVTNGAALFGRDGALVGRYEKCFLWHFDSRWFAPGGDYPVFETDVGPVGMLVCADGRLPEIARMLALQGARIILDLTAWVSGGRRPEDLTSVQREYLIPVRAAENGVWVACADKAGVEADSVVYCGRSCVVDPSGAIVAELGPSDEGILVYEVPPGEVELPIPRRPELYASLTTPTDDLPVMDRLREPVVIADCERRVAVVQMTAPEASGDFLRRARDHVARMALQDASLVLLPATPGRLRAAYPHDEILDGMLRIAREHDVMLAFTVSEDEETGGLKAATGGPGSGHRAMYLVGPDGVIGRHRQTHKPRGDRFATMPMGDEPCNVFDTPAGRVGMLLGPEGFVPEVARSLMLRGAEVLLWAADAPPQSMAMFARARADENRVFVACASAPAPTGATMIVDPAGRVLAQALEGRELAVSATVNRALSHLKAMAPGTDVVRNRQPASYALLADARSPAGAVL